MYQFFLYGLIFPEELAKRSDMLIRKFDKCRRNNLNSIWAIETLYIPGNSITQFMNILERNLKPIYETARMQGYEIWKVNAERV